MGTDEQINQMRRRLRTLIEQTRNRVILANRLIQPKARLAPNSSEANAYAVLLNVRQDIDAWLLEAAELCEVQVNPPAAERERAAPQ